MKRAIIVLVIVAAVGGGAAAYYLSHNGQQVSAQTTAITRGDIVDAVASTGTLQPVISVTVGSQVSANIAWLGADFNSIVKKGQVIAKLDPTLFESQVAQAKAQLEQTKASLENAKAQQLRDQANANYQRLTYQRDLDLRKQQLISQDQLDQAKAAADQASAALELDKAQIQQQTANIQQATAQLNTSQTNLEHTIITSPIDGIVTQRSVDVGQTVAASMQAPTLFIIAADLTKMQVNANIDEADVGRIRPSQHVSFKVDALDQTPAPQIGSFISTASSSISSDAIFSRHLASVDNGAPSLSCVFDSVCKWRNALRRRGPCAWPPRSNSSRYFA